MVKIKTEVGKLKNALKYIGLFVIGLLVPIVVYPVMHEVSHSIVATIAGARVINVTIFPLPHMLCEMRNTNDISSVAIGLSGMILPFIFSAFIKLKNFWLWYANYIVLGISALSFAISIVSVVLFMSGNPISNDDITQILMICPNIKWIILVITFLLFVISVIKLFGANVLKKCVEHFI